MKTKWRENRILIIALVVAVLTFSLFIAKAGVIKARNTRDGSAADDQSAAPMPGAVSEGFLPEATLPPTDASVSAPDDPATSASVGNPTTPADQTAGAPVNPATSASSGASPNADGSFNVTLAVYCHMLKDATSLKKDKREQVPVDGVILAPVEALAYEGESVFDILRRELKRAKIHLEFMNTPFYNSAYIEGIHNLYEFDAGELSGWVYKVNDAFPNIGSSRCLLSPGDRIEWHYSLELGQDIEGYMYEGFQKDE